jgi:heptosyltransferase III
VSAVAVRGALAVHPGALGDVLLAVPALRALRGQHGAVMVAARRHIAELLAALDEADAVHDFESLHLDALFAGDGRAQLPDAERVVCWFGARDVEFTRRLRAQAPGALVAPSTAGGLVWAHLLATSGARRESRVAADVAPALRAAGRAALMMAGWDGRRPVLLVQPGAGGVTKRWPADGFAAALDGAGRREIMIVVHEGPADAAAASALIARLPGALLLRDPALPVLAGVLAESAAFLGNDSGVSHLAATVGTPAVVLFAADNLAWRPWAEEPAVLAVTMTGVEASEVAAVRAAVERRLV